MVGLGAPAAARFDIVGAVCPHLLNRLTGCFAQLDLVPAEVGAAAASGEMRVHVVIDALAPETAQRIAAKMRAMVMVTDVALRLED